MSESTWDDFQALFADDEYEGTIGELLEVLLRMGALEGKPAGVAQQVLDPEHGIETLSLQQCKTLYAGIAAYEKDLLIRTCWRCGHDIAWGWRIWAVEKRDQCSTCANYEANNP